MEARQVVGLIEMINEIVKLDPTISTLIEIGSHIGESATIFLGFSNFKKIYCVDPYVTSPFFEVLFNKRLSRYFETRCFPVKLNSYDFAKIFNEPLDMVYIDGADEYESVKQDLSIWYKKLRIDGFLSGHDYAEVHTGRKRAIDEFIGTYNLPLKKFEDNSWYVRKK